MTTFYLCAPLQMDQAVRDLLADVQLAMKRADISHKAAALTMRVPLSKLSEQLHGHLPPTFLWRMTTLGSAFWWELVAIRAKRLGGELFAGGDVVRLLHAVERVERRMLKADLKGEGSSAERMRA